jgi:hypothetical protein
MRFTHGAIFGWRVWVTVTCLTEHWMTTATILNHSSHRYLVIPVVSNNDRRFNSIHAESKPISHVLSKKSQLYWKVNDQGILIKA